METGRWLILLAWLLHPPHEDGSSPFQSFHRLEFCPYSVGIFLNAETEDWKFSRFKLVTFPLLYGQSSLLLGVIYKNTFHIHLFPAWNILLMSWFGLIIILVLICPFFIALSILHYVACSTLCMLLDIFEESPRPWSGPSSWELFPLVSGEGFICRVILYRQPV